MTLDKFSVGCVSETNMHFMKRKKFGGRTKKNSSSRHINFIPTQQVLDIYDSWAAKSINLNQAIIEFHERNQPES